MCLCGKFFRVLGRCEHTFITLHLLFYCLLSLFVLTRINSGPELKANTSECKQPNGLRSVDK